MAETDRDAIRRSLGLKPRAPSSSEAAAPAEPEPAPATTATTTAPPSPAPAPAGAAPAPAAAPAAAAPAPATVAAPAPVPAPAPPPAAPAPRSSGLGFQRRSAAPAAERHTSSSSGRSAVALEAPPQPITDPAKKPVGKLPPDAQLLLRRYYMLRPEIDLPPFVLDLPGTHGWYLGDGRPEREILIGWTPAFVLYTSPLFPEGGVEWVKGELLMPGLHSQPLYTERGFKVGAPFNVPNMSHCYLVWKAPEPLKVAPSAPTNGAAAPGVDPNESPRDRRRREEMERRKRDLEARKSRNSDRLRR